MAGVRVLFDSSVLIPGLLGIHPHHRAAAAALDLVHRGEIHGLASTHALAETFAMLSGLPLRPPPDPAALLSLLRTAVVARFEIVPLDLDDYMAVLEEMPAGGFRGRILYDALHLRAARKARAAEILTYNLRDFRRLAPDLAGRIRAP